jgi:hypothetical protein
MTIQINTCKGNATFSAVEAAAAWLVEYQPAFSDIAGASLVDSDGSRCDENGCWTEEGAAEAIREALAELVADGEEYAALLAASEEYTAAFTAE